MVIDLQKCVGCGACAISCKTQNSTQNKTDGQTYNWADFLITKGGTFPKVKYENRPVLCNHCSNAACVEACPVTPKAMFKDENGVTLHNDERCIGCRSCQRACPYSEDEVTDSSSQYSVISFNDFSSESHPLYRDSEELIPGCTTSGMEYIDKTKTVPPHKTGYKHSDYDEVRRAGVVEKCILCAHRIYKDEDPYCVTSCPSGARIFGDKDDPNSEISKQLKKHSSSVLKPEAGTEPNVYYVRNFKPV